MFEPKDIENVQFEKVLMGGYKCDSVDGFLFELFNDYEALFNENNQLKQKLKLVATKLSEYKQSEEFIKNSITYSEKVREDAEEKIKADAEILKQDLELEISNKKEIARLDHQMQMNLFDSQIRKEQAVLDELKQSVSNFRKNLEELYIEHLELISKIPQEKPAIIEENLQTKQENTMKQDVHEQTITFENKSDGFDFKLNKK